MRCFGNAGFLPKVSFFLDQLITSYTLCAGGSGLCFVTDTMFLAHRFTDPVTLYNVGAGMRTLSVVSRGSRKKTPAMEAFIAAAERLHSGTI